MQAPLIAEQRREYERILRETNQLTSQLAEALQERDHHIKRAKVSEDREKQTKLENEVLQSQLSDLGAQIRGLLRDQAVQQDPSLFSVEMDDVAANKSGDLDLNDDSANAIITSHLLLFKSLPELQRQNQKLLKTARMLATKWESREEEFRVELSKEESAALEEAKMAVDQIADELEGQKRVNAALAKERDMYRAMCVRVGRGDESRRSSGGRDVDMEFAGAGARDGDGTDYRKLWEEQKDALENIKRELGYDTGTLKNDLATRQREVGQLGAKLAKANAQIELLNGTSSCSLYRFPAC
jgi:nucleoprotein TPR